MQSTKLKNIDKWAKDRPFFIAIIAPQIAVSAQPCYQFLKVQKSGQHINPIKQVPELKYWLLLYKDHRILESYIKKAFLKFGEFAGIGIELFDLFKLNRKQRLILGSEKFNNSIKREIEALTQDEWEEIKEFWNSIYNASIEDIKSDLDNGYNQELALSVKASLHDPEMIFFFRIFVPCWLLYGVFPCRLLRSARLGNIDDLEKLIRIDKSIIHDPKISAYLHKESLNINRSKYNYLINCLKKGPKSKITLKAVKMNFAGFISFISSAFGEKFRLKEPEIRDLFDAVAKDSGKGDIDTDLPESPESFVKAIQRERKFWSFIPQPGQKIV
jgi:hypothetical protein